MLAALVASVVIGSGFGSMVATGPNENHGVAPCEVQTAVRGDDGGLLYYTCKY